MPDALHCVNLQTCRNSTPIISRRGRSFMEMQQVRYFLALSTTLNFTRAAEECNVTQPALTRAIKTLEDELGGELLRRERQHSHLTELGRRMLPLLQQCYEAANSAKSLAKAVQSSDVAPLNVTISNSVNIALLVSPFTELFRAYPGVHMKISRGSPTTVVEALKNGDVELAVAGQLGAAWDRLDTWPLSELGRAPFVCVAAASRADARRRRLLAGLCRRQTVPSKRVNGSDADQNPGSRNGSLISR
ncbi:LysR family transcriptional regulator [Mesorhizobium calcicola]|uniref:LysR family transcriptional regulator n=1 Tax=Mesorhizobium calcicola TaxID=1300310 RepID=A0ABW4WJX5_9HYPH